jgi:hypothetical protein
MVGYLAIATLLGLASRSARSERKIFFDMEVSREHTRLVCHLTLDRPRQLAAASGVSRRRLKLLHSHRASEYPTTFNLAQLQQFALAQANVTYFAAGSVVTESFTGTLLWDLLNNSPVGGIVTDPTVKNDILHKIVIVTGTDCYQSAFGAGEFDPFFGGSQIMVAYESGGQLLGSAGFARIVVPGDKAGGRFVSNIANIDVEDASSYPITPPKW